MSMHLINVFNITEKEGMQFLIINYLPGRDHYFRDNFVEVIAVCLLRIEEFLGDILSVFHSRNRLLQLFSIGVSAPGSLNLDHLGQHAQILPDVCWLFSDAVLPPQLHLHFWCLRFNSFRKCISNLATNQGQFIISYGISGSYWETPINLHNFDSFRCYFLGKETTSRLIYY